MTDGVDEVRALIESRLREIEQEASGLRSAVATLGGSQRAGAGPKAKRRPAKRAPRGQRREQFLDAVRKAPGSSAAQVGKAIGVSTNQAYALGQRLLKDKAVTKKGSGYSAAK